MKFTLKREAHTMLKPRNVLKRQQPVDVGEFLVRSLVDLTKKT